MEILKISPIGKFNSIQKNPYDAPRQPGETAFDGTIELLPGRQFEQAIIGLEKFSHIWVLFQFHMNNNWKPMVMPPRGSETKVGVFASRSPYRPNPLGISVLKLKKIEGLIIHVEQSDMLDGTPIFDLKPYLPYSDSFPEATNGWLDLTNKCTISYSSTAEEQIQWLKNNGIPQIASFIVNQLEYNPTNSELKRVSPLDDEGNYEIAYRTWRIKFSLLEQDVFIEQVYTGYTDIELNDPAKSNEDPHQDKETHRKFIKEFVQKSE